MTAFEQDKFLPNYDDNEIIYWEDDWIFYKFPNKITEENKHEAECFDLYNNKFLDFSRETCRSFWHDISEESYNNAKNKLLENLKKNS